LCNCAHDDDLALNICNEIRPEIDVILICWVSNPNNRPNAIEIENLTLSFYKDEETKKQIEEVDTEYRKTNFLFIKNNPSIHLQAYYTFQLLNPFIKDLPNLILQYFGKSYLISQSTLRLLLLFIFIKNLLNYKLYLFYIRCNKYKPTFKY
jgi:hypothetical protein